MKSRYDYSKGKTPLERGQSVPVQRATRPLPVFDQQSPMEFKAKFDYDPTPPGCALCDYGRRDIPGVYPAGAGLNRRQRYCLAGGFVTQAHGVCDNWRLGKETLETGEQLAEQFTEEL